MLYRKGAIEGVLEIVKCLVNDGKCDVNIGNETGITPLHMACV